jgi:hypothetical protein
MRRRPLQQAFGLTLIVLLLTGCGGAPVEPTSTSTPLPVPPTATLSAGPPCFGLIQADKLPDWAGGLAFGEMHSSDGSFTDLTSVVGCKVEGGVILINEDGRFFSAYIDDCENFESSDIPPEELRPASDDPWICNQPTGDGGIQFMQRKG